MGLTVTLHMISACHQKEINFLRLDSLPCVTTHRCDKNNISYFIITFLSLALFFPALLIHLFSFLFSTSSCFFTLLFLSLPSTPLCTITYCFSYIFPGFFSLQFTSVSSFASSSYYSAFIFLWPSTSKYFTFDRLNKWVVFWGILTFLGFEQHLQVTVYP